MTILSRPIAGARLGEVLIAAAAFFALYAVLAGAALDLDGAGRIGAAALMLAVHAVLSAAVYPLVCRYIPAGEAPQVKPSKRRVKLPFRPPSWARIRTAGDFSPARIRERMLERFGHF